MRGNDCRALCGRWVLVCIGLQMALVGSAVGYAQTGTSIRVGQFAGDVRGVTRAEASATISSEIVARVAALPFRAGQRFKAGDVLVSFDCQRYDADLRAAEAEVKTQQIHVSTNRQLLQHRAAGVNDLLLAEAKLAQAMAGAESLRVRARQCTIAAPYDGQIVERLVDVFDMPAANAGLMKIVKVGAIDLDLIVPSSWSPSLSSGRRFDFKVDETNTTHVAVLLHVGAVVDPVSRTIRVHARVLDPGQSLRPGMSGIASLGVDGEGAKP